MNNIASVNGRRLSDEEARERIATLESGYNNVSGGLEEEVEAREALDVRVANVEEWAAEHKTVEVGTVTLTNSLEFPFNNSQQSIALAVAQANTDYVVATELTASTGNAGEIEVTDKLINGFKMACTGSASSVTIKYMIVGGFEE